MPNTLVHFGIQGALNRAVLRRADVRWVFLGCMIPDLPWILRRAVSWLGGVDPYALIAYCTVQASLAFCLLLGLALASLASRPIIVFAILGVNSFVHLLLDAIQIKWGGGVHLFAPFSWEQLSFGWFWPDSLPALALTAVGLGLTLWLVFLAPWSRIPVEWQAWKRLSVVVPLFAGYLLVPLGLLSGPLNSDTRSLAALQAVSERAGKPIKMDRVPYRKKPGGDVVVTFAGEELRVEGKSLPASGYASLQGTFIDSTTLSVDELHADRAWLRDGASYLGLALFILVWLRRR